MVAALLGGECQVWWAGTRHAGPSALGLLDAVERDRHEAFRDAAARDRFTVGRAVTRLACGRLLDRAPREIRLEASCARCGRPHGRPRLSGAGDTLQISLAHSGEYVVVAVAGGVAVGVDVERVVLRGGRAPLSALSTAERAVLDALPEPRRAAAFVRYWVRKEAVLKATGHGLGVPPRRLTVSPPDAPAALLSWTGRPAPDLTVHLVDLPAPEGYAACLASLGRPLQVTRWDADALFAQYEDRILPK